MTNLEKNIDRISSILGKVTEYNGEEIIIKCGNGIPCYNCDFHYKNTSGDPCSLGMKNWLLEESDSEVKDAKKFLEKAKRERLRSEAVKSLGEKLYNLLESKLVDITEVPPGDLLGITSAQAYNDGINSALELVLECTKFTP